MLPWTTFFPSADSDPMLAASDATFIKDLIKRFFKVKINKVESIVFAVHLSDLIEKIKEVGQAAEFASEAVLGFLNEVVVLEATCYTYFYKSVQVLSNHNYEID
ncbi:hypothetical protein DMUE_2932 [Dictyocoela muelleri]|nr:hypothetical protein EQH57_0086 [Dictyocoela roeselum]KAG0438686.1 hypothetical protein DMUE_2932 [Dictyocoela muelleri]